MSIYTELKAAGVPLDHHESDLYAKVTPESKKIIESYAHKTNVHQFLAKGELWYDIPFAFDLFWEAKSRSTYKHKHIKGQGPTTGKDQYGGNIPDDLVVIPNIDDLSIGEIEIVEHAEWYEHESSPQVILVSARAIDYLSETDPIDAGVNIKKGKIRRIDHALKRHDITSGFYHA